MEISVRELTNKSKNYFEITNSKDCLKLLKMVNSPVFLKISFDTLNLGQKLYGKNKKESVKIQKKNCKYILRFYRILKKAVKILLKKQLLNKEIVVENLSKKLNNNDYMIESMLIVDFSLKTHHEKMKASYESAAVFMDKENSLNKMCDFRDNQCLKFREKKEERVTGCCPTYCKLLVPGQACVHKNLSCKIFMCESVIKKGYYFTPYTLAILKKNMSPMQILILSGSFFMTTDKALKRLWIVRLFRTVSAIAILLLIYTLIF